MNRAQFTRHMKLNPYDAGNFNATHQESLSEENINRLTIGVINHIRSLGGDARITLQDHAVRTHNGYKQKKGEPEGKFSNLIGKYNNKKIAVAVGQNAVTAERQKRMARENGYQYFNAFDMKGFRDFLASL